MTEKIWIMITVGKILKSPKKMLLLVFFLIFIFSIVNKDLFEFEDNNDYSASEKN